MDNNKTVVVSEQALQALALMNMLNGNTEQANGLDADEMFNDSEELNVDGLEVVFEDEKPKKKATRKKSEPSVPVKPHIPDWDCGTLKKSVPVMINIRHHDMPYKEQKWPIFERDVEYKLELITVPMQAQRACEFIHGNISDDMKKKAKAGEVRFYQLLTYETIPQEMRELGYVEVKTTGAIKIKLNKDLIKNSHMNYDAVERKVNKAIEEAVIINK